MRDAWGLRPAGLHSGNRVNYGNFGQCYNFKHNHATLGQIQGQNCLLHVTESPANFEIPSYRATVCIPATCPPQDLKARLQLYFNSTNLNLTIDDVTNCEHHPAKAEFGALWWCTVVFFGLFGAVVLVATLHERFSTKKLPNYCQFMSSFAIYPNLVQVMNVGGKQARSSVRILDGIRAISVLWIIYQHTFFMQLSFPLINDNYKYQVIQKTA